MYASRSRLHARTASGATTRRTSPSGTRRTASSCASTASGVAATRRTARPARPPWPVIVNGRKSARQNGAPPARPRARTPAPRRTRQRARRRAAARSSASRGYTLEHTTEDEEFIGDLQVGDEAYDGDDFEDDGDDGERSPARAEYAAAASTKSTTTTSAAAVVGFLHRRLGRAQARPVARPSAQLTSLTGITLMFVLIVGGYLGLLDAIFSKLVSGDPLATEGRSSNVPLVCGQHLFGSREEGQAEPRAPRPVDGRAEATCARS